MRILAIETELKTTDAQADATLLREEAAAVWALKKSGSIRDVWYTTWGRRAVVMLELPSEEMANKCLGGLPLVRDGFIRFEVMALQEYDGFERLMK